MKKQTAARKRKELTNRLAMVLAENIKTLSPELRGVLLDDLVTALENRLTILNRATQNAQFASIIMEGTELETIET